MDTHTASLPMGEADALQLTIGVEPAERLQWALDFAETDLAGQTSFDREKLRWQVFLFANTPIFWWDRLPSHYSKLHEQFGRRRNSMKYNANVPGDKLVAKIQLRFRKILATLRRDGVVTHPLTLTYTVAVAKPGTVPEREIRPENYAPVVYFLMSNTRIEPLRSGEMEQAALATFLELLAGHPGSLRICPEPKCGRWFVSKKDSQTFCNPKCQSRFTTRTHRERSAKKEKHQ